MKLQKKFASKSPEYVKKYSEEYYQKTKAKRFAAEKEKVHCDIVTVISQRVDYRNTRRHKGTEVFVMFVTMTTSR
jgi:hypothetical protein